MYTWGDRLGVLAIAAAVLAAALKMHKSRQKGLKWAGVVASALAGCAFLMTIIGNWIAAHSAVLGIFAAALLIIAAVWIGVDCIGDRTPDKKSSFWFAFLMPLLLVVGLAQVPTVWSQIGTGGNQVMSTVSNTNGYTGNHAPARKR